MKKNRRSFGVNVGSSSILLIFVVLCLVAFAVLSIVSAYVDYNLSKKLAQRSQNYYAACNEAEEFLANLEESLTDVMKNSVNEQEYFASAGENSFFCIELSENQKLEVKAKILYPPKDGRFYTVESWQVITDDSMELDDTLELFDEEDLQLLF